MKTSLLAIAGAILPIIVGCQNDAQSANANEGTRPQGSAIQSERPSERQPSTNSDNNAPTKATAAVRTTRLEVPGLASCKPGSYVADTLSWLANMADADGDGGVSKQEATTATSFFVGGFFFRADADGDGKVTKEEGHEARVEFLRDHPGIDELLREARGATGKNPLAMLGDFLDINYDKPISIAEARNTSRAAVNDLFSSVDANRDGSITLAEIQAAGWRAARSIGDTAFKAADVNNDNQLSAEEFQQALAGPAKAGFDVADRDKNGQLSHEEAASAVTYLTKRLGI